ncbi:hypothetical protein HK28_13210 [Acetobacter sp. DsW_063]|nr:hypothetical protein HK28_13210 [Acetobacter sp. DsW_063]
MRLTPAHADHPAEMVRWSPLNVHEVCFGEYLIGQYFSEFPVLIYGAGRTSGSGMAVRRSRS